MALESWRVTFLRVGIPTRNHIIVLTIQPEKPLKGESDFFPSNQGSHSIAPSRLTQYGLAETAQFPVPRHGYGWDAALWVQCPSPA